MFFDNSKFFVRCLSHSFIKVVDHDGFEYAGYLAFLAILSFFPFLFFFTAIAANFSSVIGATNLGQQFVILITEYIPADIISEIKPRIEEIASGPPQGLLTLAIVGAIWTSSSAVEGIRTVLNRACRVKTQPPYVFRRFMSIIQFFIIVTVIMSVMLSFTLIPVFFQLFKFLFEDMVVYNYVWGYIRYGISFIVLLIGLSWLYVMIPNKHQTWKSVIPGAFLVVCLWILAATGLSFYIKSFHQVNLIYGSLAGFIVVLLFFYILSFCFIYGAEFNYNFSKGSRKRNEHLRPPMFKQDD